MQKFFLSFLANNDVGEGIEVDVLKVLPEERDEMHHALAQLLRRFKIDWNTMRAVMMATGAVISGSAVLAVLNPGEFVPQDLDIYVTSAGFAAVLVFLRDYGYDVEIPPYRATESKYSGPTVVLTLRNQTGEKVDLIATTEPHVVHTITQFHSTCVMNYIAYYGIVCLYPEWTMRKAGLVLSGPLDYRAISKYQGRGFAMKHASAELPKYERTHECRVHHCCPLTRQELGDSMTLFVPFENEEINVESEEQVTVRWALRDVRECRK